MNKIRKGDHVIVLAGRDKGKRGTVTARVDADHVTVEGVTYRNLIARFGPTTGPVVIIGAHYDSYGNVYAGSSDPRGHSPDSHTPGADDNASGVAGLLEVARLLGEHPPNRQVELVAYALEEPPHFRTAYMGSDVHAYLRIGDQALVARLPPEELPAPGSTLRLRMAPTQLHWFDPVDGVAVGRR